MQMDSILMIQANVISTLAYTHSLALNTGEQVISILYISVFLSLCFMSPPSHKLRIFYGHVILPNIKVNN